MDNETRMVTDPDDIERALKIDRTDEEIRDREPVKAIFGKLSSGHKDVAPEEVAEHYREYDIVPAVRRDARKFRARIRDFQDTVNRLIHMVEAAIQEKDVKNVQFAEIANLFMVVAGGKLDDAIDLIYDYCPNLETDKDWIEDHGIDDQFQTALINVIKVAFGPFVRLAVSNVRILRHALSGGSNGEAAPVTPPTDTTEPPEDGSVRSTNGTNSPTKSTPISPTNCTT